MVQSATLTYLDAVGQPILTFELDCQTTIVGRAPLKTATFPQDVDWVLAENTYQVRQGDTLYIAIAQDIAMCRQHFSIRRRAAMSGEAVYFLQDLNSRCGTLVNGIRTALIQLNHGDLIRCSSQFLFSFPRGIGDPSNDSSRTTAGTRGGGV